MEANRPSSAKWVSRRTLDSQANSRDHNARASHAHGPAPRSSFDIANNNTSNTLANLNRRKFDSSEVLLSSMTHSRNEMGGGNGGYRTNSNKRFNAVGSGTGGGWSGVSSNASPNANKLNPHASRFPSNAAHSHGPHGGNNNNNNNRRGYGGGYNEPSEPAMPPPPRSVQMGKRTLSAHTGLGTAANIINPPSARGFIPQPRHGKVNNNISSNTPKPMDHSSSSSTHDGGAVKRWISASSTPAPHGTTNSAGSNVPSAATTPAMATAAGTAASAAAAVAAATAAAPNAASLPPPPPPSTTTATRCDAHAVLGPDVSRFAPPSTPSTFTAPSRADVAARSVSLSPSVHSATNTTVTLPLLPPPAAAAAAAATAPAAMQPNLGGSTSSLNTLGGSGVVGTPSADRAIPPSATASARLYAAPAHRPAVTSPLDALHLAADNFSFGAEDVEGPGGIQPSEIEALLGEVVRSAAAPHASRDAALGGSLRERRSVADWGIEEAIKTVLPGMDEDDIADGTQGLNVFSQNIAAIAGTWHTSGDADARHAATGAGSGLLADFPTSFAASFSEPISAVLNSPFTGDPTTNALDSLSRAFSTAARAGSSSFATSPATTTTNATPPHLPPTSPGMHPPHYTTPVEAMATPASARDVAPRPHSSFAGLPPSTSQVAESPSAFGHKMPMGLEDVGNGSIQGTSELLSSFQQSSLTSTMSPWLSTGYTESNSIVAAVAALGHPPEPAEPSGAKAARGASGERSAELQPPHSGLPSAPAKESSMNSVGGLTGSGGSGSAGIPAVPPTRQSTATTASSHGGNSAPTTPSLRKEVSTPLSASRSQTYTPGGSRLQRPSLAAPIVNRHTIAQIFRETPQSLRRKEKMEQNHEHNPLALCKDPQWPPHNEADVEQMLKGRGATKLLRHLTIISFSRQHVSGVQELFDTWAKNGIPAPDMGFGAYYYYVKEKSEKLLCMKHNGRGASPGHGYGRCDFESRRPYSTCRYEHVCLFCRSKEHGWFEEGKCQGYQQLLTEMEELGIHEDDVMTLLNAMERTAKASWVR